MTPHPARDYRARWGLLALLQHKFLRRLDHYLGLRVSGIYRRPLEAPTGPDPVVPGFVFCFYRAGDIAKLLADGDDAAFELSAAFIADAFGKGDVCEAILFNGKIVSFTWSASSVTHDQDGVFVTFDDRHRYVYFAYTLEEFRGRHLPRLFTPIKDRYWLSRGRTHSITYIALDNRSSILLTLASGYARIGFAAYLKRGRWFLSFRTPGARAHGFRFFIPPRES